MMPLAELDRLVELVDPDSSCSVADQAAAPWGYEAGRAKWRRSSASHVFVLLADERPSRYLRFVPESARPLAAVSQTATLMQQLADAGVAVVRPVPSARGRLTELIPTSIGPMCATVVESAPGKQIDADDLTQDYAVAWGSALASLHKAGRDIAFPVVQRFDDLGRLIATGDAISAVVRSLLTRLQALPADDRHFGLVHGDFELDNIAWGDGVPTSFDFDEAACSWFAADVAFALRDLQADANGGEARKDMIDAFLSGYRQVRPFDSDDEDSLELFTQLNAARALATILEVLAADGRPQDHPGLYQRLQRFVHRQRAIVLNEVAAP